MTAAELTAHADDRHPWDWYIDESWCTDALVRTLGFEAFDGQHIHDPCCGRGTIPHYFDQYGFSASGGDVEDRRGAYGFPVGDWRFAIHDFYRIAALPSAFVGLPPAQAELPRRKLSIVFNPPYTLQDKQRNVSMFATMFVTAFEFTLLPGAEDLADFETFHLDWDVAPFGVGKAGAIDGDPDEDGVQLPAPATGPGSADASDHLTLPQE